MEEIDIWRAAKKLIDMYGEEVITYAVKRAQQLAADDNKMGAYVMSRTAEAIDVLQRKDSEGFIVH